jgi:hypothetical protein
MVNQASPTILKPFFERLNAEGPASDFWLLLSKLFVFDTPTCAA